MIERIKEILKSLPGSLSRITSGSVIIPEIDGLRFLAIAPVVLQHFSERIIKAYPPATDAGNAIARLLSHGHIGVYIFFAISGFILALPFGKYYLLGGKRVSLAQYFIRRITRIEPPYLIAMTILFFVLIVVQHVPFDELFPHYLAGLLYIHRLVYDTWSPINPPAWTLEIEVQFYLVAPLLIAFYFRIRNYIIRRSALCLVVAVKVVISNATTLLDNFYLTLPFTIEYFLIGILAADVFLTRSSSPSKQYTICFDILCLISIVVLFSTWTWNKDIWSKSLFLFALFSIFYTCFQSGVVRYILSLPWITAIGGMCYSIYLLHLGFAELFVSLVKKSSPFDTYIENLIVFLPVFLGCLFIVSATFFKLVEQPFMDSRWPQKLWSKVRTLLAT